jgi:6-phosphogluconolactonase (cycloisomerase 2 family)
MRTGQGIGPSSSRRALRNVLLLIPAVVIIAATLNTMSCSNNGLLPQVHGGGSNTPTATPTGGTGALAFVTNFNDGKVSSFTRNTTTGVLKRSGQVTAGAKKGPKGLVAAPSGSFLYVANNSDGNIYQFSINATTGVLTPLSPAFVSNGSGSGPDEIAINPAGTFVWVTGALKGTVTTYSINTSTGQLTQITTKVTGLTTPFGITATGTFVYVADTGAGLVYSYSINADGTLTQIGSPVSDLGGSGGSPGFIAVDPGGGFIYVTDLNAGVLAVLKTVSGALSFFSTVPTTTTGNKPIGIGFGAVTSVGNFVFTANQAVSSLWSFLITTPGFPSTPVETATTDLSAPTGLVVDPQVAFLYVTNQNAGTVSQFALTSTCLNTGAPCLVGSIATESPANANSGPFEIILAQ